MQAVVPGKQLQCVAWLIDGSAAAQVGGEGARHELSVATSCTTINERRNGEFSKSLRITTAGFPLTTARGSTLKVRNVSGNTVAPSPTVSEPAMMQSGPIQTLRPMTGRPSPPSATA